MTSHNQLGNTGLPTGFWLEEFAAPYFVFKDAGVELTLASPMWDLAESPTSTVLLEAFYNSGKPIALVCHSPGVLRHVTYQGAPLVKGKHVAGFTNGEEEVMQLTKVVPFLLEDELLRLGAIYEKVANWEPLAITDGHLIGAVDKKRPSRTEEL